MRTHALIHLSNCESHRNIRVLNIFARTFSRPYRGYKEKRVGGGGGRKSNVNNKSVVPKKRKSRQDAKEDKQLDLLFRSFYAENNGSGIQSNLP